MNPITLETVTDPLIYTIGKIGLALAAVLIVAFILIEFIIKKKNSDKLVNWFAGTAIGVMVTFGVMSLAGVEVHHSNLEDAVEVALSEVESSTGATLLGTDEITYNSLQLPNNIIPVTIDLDGDVFDGRLRVDDRGNITLLAPNPHDTAIMVPFDKEEFRTAEAEAAEEKGMRAEETASRSQARPAPTINGKTILHFGQPGLLPPHPDDVGKAGTEETQDENARPYNNVRYGNGTIPQDVKDALARPEVEERVYRTHGE